MTYVYCDHKHIVYSKLIIPEVDNTSLQEQIEKDYQKSGIKVPAIHQRHFNQSAIRFVCYSLEINIP